MGEKMSSKRQKNSNQNGKGNRFLIIINVLGGSGPLRFLVNERELVAAVIDTALKYYAREGRLPILGSNLNNFFLYRANAGCDALNPWETIGSCGGRYFLLCKKKQQQQQRRQTIAKSDATSTTIITTSKGNGSWKAWLNKYLSLKISSLVK